MSSDGARVLGDTDATMMDIPRKGQLPGKPPDGVTSWISMVTGTSAGGRPNPESLLTDEFVMERLSVEFPNGADGEAVITIGQEVLEVMNGLWKQCMIVKVLGRTVPIAVLSKKLQEMWRPQGVMTVLDLPRGFFMVRFGVEEEYLAALTGGPWKMFGSYLLVQAWSSEFDPLKDEIVTAPVWVRLSHLPVNFYHRSILMGIAKGLGKLLRVDQTTLNVERARFARICVEVNLRQPLKGSMMINGERYYVSYEGLTNICSGCEIYGHALHQCPRRVSPVSVEPESERALVEEASRGDAEAGFVMARNLRQSAATAQRPVVFAAKSVREPPRRALKEIPQRQSLGNISLSNTFDRLREDIAEIEVGEGNGVNAGDKENAANLGITFNDRASVSGKEGKLAGDPRNLNRETRKGAGERKVGSSKGGSSKLGGTNGPRRKPISNYPTRGLIVGPVEHDLELQSSGKRSRVEREDPRWPETQIARFNADKASEGMVGLVEGDGRNQSNSEIDAAANSLLVLAAIGGSLEVGGMDLVRD
ncbi:unnamed protein product [Microthlaspi erraticum]|uniref:DUF4283 domain-containing protein n=1 Tax=Microthlaspi erraticum TaxID=1685480 RepID=A0A6D2IMQ5_9BRAS|nr:unnamed protein product [Microthlaspi erraticum]